MTFTLACSDPALEETENDSPANYRHCYHGCFSRGVREYSKERGSIVQAVRTLRCETGSSLKHERRQ